MLNRITIYLAEEEFEALQKLSRHELRGLREEARHLIRLALRRHLLLACDIGTGRDAKGGSGIEPEEEI